MKESRDTREPDSQGTRIIEWPPNIDKRGNRKDHKNLFYLYY